MPHDLAALVGSRICHDLISPIGAIGNGVELLALTDGATGAEMNLISESVENANARIRFFRIAFGAAASDQMISRAEVESILAAVAQAGRFSYDWRVMDDQPRNQVRCAFLLILCFEAGMPTGGQILITQNGGVWRVHAESPRLKIDATLWSSLTTQGIKIRHTAAQVQFALLPEVLAEAKRNLKLDLKADTISATF